LLPFFSDNLTQGLRGLSALVLVDEFWLTNKTIPHLSPSSR
jgi:hypothetical protein